MEKYPYPLECLYINLKSFFDSYLPSHSAQLGLFKKHTVAKRGIEISSYFGSCVDSYVSSRNIRERIESKEFVDCLREASQSWALPLSDISIRDSSLFLKLSRQHAFRTVLSAILLSEGQYGDKPALTLMAVITCTTSPARNLTEYRSILLAGIARNLITCAGYQVTETSDDVDIKLHFVAGKSCGSVLCGPVIGSDGRRADISVEDYHRLRERDMQAMCEQKYWEADTASTVKKLAAAAVVMDLIQSKSGNAVKLVTDDQVVTSARESSSRGAAFILYNCARLAVIQSKFEKGVAEGVYPPLPPVQDIDISALTQEEEWQLLFDFLLEYPDVLSGTVARADKGEVNHNILCSFLFRLCHLFSVYYRRCRILSEPKPHLLSTIFARLVLAKAIDCVLKHALNILNITVIDHM